MNKDVAKEFRVGVNTVSKLVSKASKNPRFIDELFSKQELKSIKYSEVEDVVNTMIDNNEFIDSCKYVTNKVNEFKLSSSNSDDPVYRPDITETEIRIIMKDMGLKYRKVNHIAMSANSERSLVLRQ